MYCTSTYPELFQLQLFSVVLWKLWVGDINSYVMLELLWSIKDGSNEHQDMVCLLLYYSILFYIKTQEATDQLFIILSENVISYA